MLGFIFVFVVTIVLIKFFNNNNDYWTKRNVIQVKGVLWEFLFKKKALPLSYKEIYERHRKLPYVGVFLGLKPALVVLDLKNVQAILHTDFQSFYARGFKINDTDRLGDNLFFTENYDRWKLIRQNITPSISTSKIRNMLPLTQRCAMDFVKYVDENPHILKNPYKAIYKYATACISSTIFGLDKETQNTMKTPFNVMSAKSVKPTLVTNIRFAIANISPKLYKALNLQAFGKHEHLFTEVLRNAMQKRRNENETNDDFIGTCIKLQDEGTIKDFVTGYEAEVTMPFLAAQAFVFIIGGIESASNALHFTLLELSNNPTVLERIHNEIDGLFRNNDGTLTYEDVAKLEYTEMVINEAMRLHPPIGAIQRRCCKDTILPVGGINIDKDTIVVIPIYAIHRDEKYFTNPEVFDPERFSADNITKIEKFSYMPFGEGKRICIAVKFSIMEMKVYLAWLLRTYTVKPHSFKPRDFAPSFFSLHVLNATLDIVPRDAR